MEGLLTVEYDVPPDRVVQAALASALPKSAAVDYAIVDSIKVECSFAVPQAVSRGVFDLLMDGIDDVLRKHFESLGVEMKA